MTRGMEMPHMRTLMVLAALTGVLWLLSPAEAQTPVNPTTVEVTLPQTNADGSNLTDLASIQFCEGTSATAPLTNCVSVTAPADPPASATASTLVAAFGALTDGTHYVDAAAVDTVGNRSARVARIPFEWNRQAPAAPSGLRVLP